MRNRMRVNIGQLTKQTLIQFGFNIGILNTDGVRNSIKPSFYSSSKDGMVNIVILSITQDTICNDHFKRLRLALQIDMKLI